MKDSIFKRWDHHVRNDPVRNKLVIPDVVRVINECRENIKIADIGSGSGYISNEVNLLANNISHIYCIDQDKAAIDYSYSKYFTKINNVTLINQSVEAISSEVFGVTVAYIVFSIVEMEVNDTLIEKIHRMLEKKGKLIIYIPDFISDICELADMRSALINYMKGCEIFEGKDISKEYGMPFKARRIENIIENFLHKNLFSMVRLNSLSCNNKRIYALEFLANKMA